MTPQLAEPDEGNVGHLTWREFDRLEHAVSNAKKHLSWWRVCGHIRTGDPDEHRTRQRRKNSQPLPLPGPWLAAEEIGRLLRELNGWPELADAANDLEGQFFAHLLISEVETAMAHWPISDRPHRVRYYRCLACNQMTLKYFPPNLNPVDGDEQPITRIVNGEPRTVLIRPASVRCDDNACRAVMGEQQWEIAANIAAHEHKERERAKQ